MLRPSKEDGARIRKAAADAGKSVQRFCLDLVLPHCPEAADAHRETPPEGNRVMELTIENLRTLIQQRANLPDSPFTGPAL